MTGLYEADASSYVPDGPPPPNERPIPRDDASEQALLALALHRDDTAALVLQAVDEQDFYQQRHRAIYATIATLSAAGTKVDPVAVMSALNRDKALEGVGGANYIHTLYSVPAVAENLSYYAHQVRVRAQLRIATELVARTLQRVEESSDPDAALDSLATSAIELGMMVDQPTTGTAVPGLGTWNELWAQRDDPFDWIVEGLIERQDVLMLLAEEGLGKSWFSRQFCMAIAAGIHPLYPRQRITAHPTLYIDPENAVSMVRRQTRVLGNQVARFGTWEDSKAMRWLMPRGLNLRKSADARLFRQVIADSGAHFVSLGSLYKMFQRGGDDWDTASAEVRDVLDEIRERQRVAFLIEHHMGKGSGRVVGEENPYGSSEWMRWCSHGRVLRRVGANAFSFDSFRDDRDEREFPCGLYRGGDLPWSPILDPAELEFVADKPKGRARP